MKPLCVLATKAGGCLLKSAYNKRERYYEDTAVYGATVDDIDMAAVERYTE